jgi:hypothetical protein
MNLRENLRVLKVPFHEGFTALNLREKWAKTGDVAQKSRRLPQKHESLGWIRTTLNWSFN